MRLRDEGATALERALLDAGTAYRGSPSARAKTLGALGLAGSATVLAAGAKPALAGAGKLSLGKLSLTKLFTGAALCGAVAAVPAGYRAWHARAADGHGSRVIAAAVETPPEPANATGAAADPTMPAIAPTTAVARHRRAAVNEVPVPLSRELASVDAARAALARGDANRAIALLDRYARVYPRGRLDMEAEVLRIDALAESGRTDAAHAHAREFLRRHPNSVLAGHVRTRLAD
ncbi:MAG TPA: hypothetical protein VLT58_13600 [Polyangia bacterium]|nr:hypothetical protein [Polyangia bacterium]